MPGVTEYILKEKYVLFHLDEMKRRRDFYAAHPSADGKRFSFATLTNVVLT